MSVFRDTISKLEDKDILILLDGEPTKVKLDNVVDDLVKIKISNSSDHSFKELSVHINSIMLITA